METRSLKTVCIPILKPINFRVSILITVYHGKVCVLVLYADFSYWFTVMTACSLLCFRKFLLRYQGYLFDTIYPLIKESFCLASDKLYPQ